MQGEVSFEAEGKQWRMIYSVNALCAAEDALGMDTVSIYKKIETSKSLPLKFQRKLFWAGLYDHHPEITESMAGVLMQALGISKSGDLLGRALTMALAQEAGKSTENPRIRSAAGEMS